MNKIWRLSLVVLVVACCAWSDQVTKDVARESLSSSPPVSLLNGIVRLEYSENEGAFLGLASGLPEGARFVLLVILASASLLLMIAFTVSARGLNLSQWLGLSLLIGGGAGNLIDRIANAGAVIDFVSLGVGPLRTGVFNLADLAIVGGMILLLLGSARARREVSDGGDERESEGAGQSADQD